MLEGKAVLLISFPALSISGTHKIPGLEFKGRARDQVLKRASIVTDILIFLNISYSRSASFGPKRQGCH